MQGTVLAETEAFITRQREQLLQQRQELLNQQQAIQQQLDELTKCCGSSMYSRAKLPGQGNKVVAGAVRQVAAAQNATNC